MSFLSPLRALLTAGRGVIRGLPELREETDPIALFARWFDDAKRVGLYLPEAMTLATADAAGSPSARMVLLKQFDADGFVFYTNYGSRKAEELEANPRAALLFHWSLLQRQVRIEGTVARVATEVSEAYFHSRERGSQLGAWASRQSAVLESRRVLDDAVREVTSRFSGREVPLPEFWGGYRVTPESLEFWQGKADRLHDRLRYDREAAGYRTVRLFP